MIHASPEFMTSVRSVLPVAVLAFTGGSLLIHELDDHDTPRKELFYSWLLVFFNAYIAIFIANQALRPKTAGFYRWAFLGNGIRSVAFLVFLLCILEWEILNVRGFVLKTFFGYFTFLVVLIYGLHHHMKSLSRTAQCEQKNE